MSVENDNKAVIRRFFEEVYNQKREEVIDEIVAPDYVDYGHNPPGRGAEGAKQDLRGLLAAFSDVISIPNRDWYIANSTPTSKTLMGIDPGTQAICWDYCNN